MSIRVALVLAVTACSSGATAPSQAPVGATASCVEGASSACTCTDGGQGAQVCTAAGTFGACECTADARVARAEADAAEARLEAREATEIVERLQRDVATLDERTQKAVDMVVAAQTDADRANAKARLEALRKEKEEMDRRLAEARARAAKAERQRGTKIREECLDNPLAKGCD